MEQSNCGSLRFYFPILSVGQCLFYLSGLLIAIVFSFFTVLPATPEGFAKYFLPGFATLVGFIFVASNFYNMIAEEYRADFKKALFLEYFAMIWLFVAYISAFLAVSVFPSFVDWLKWGWILFVVLTTLFFVLGLWQICSILRKELLATI